MKIRENIMNNFIVWMIRNQSYIICLMGKRMLIAI